jgi:type IV secretory pathway VirB2 component (pilin)
MIQLTEVERLAKVKYALYGDATQSYNDEQLKLYIEEVLDEMIHAGVKENVAKSAAAVGCIACGINDIWNFSSGTVKHSDYYNRRLVQLTLRRGDEDV